MALRSASIRHIRSQVAWPSSRRLTWSGAGSRSVAQCTGRQEVPEYSDYLILSEEDLWNQCQMETFRASGPGGQHRNKTDTAVRVRHLPTGTTATATGKFFFLRNGFPGMDFSSPNKRFDTRES